MAIVRQEISDALEHHTIEYRSLSDITVEKLRSAIITGSLPPGTKITENEIAASMGVSRVVVREAMLVLIQEGLLVKERNKYTMVPSICRKDVEDVFDLRIAVEQAAAIRCLRNSDFFERYLPGLELRSEQITAASARKSTRIEALVYMDMSFHDMLVEASENTRLLSVWKEVSGPLLLLLYRYIKMGSALHYRHDDILAALHGKDVKITCNVLEQHIMDTRTALLSTYAN